MIDTVADGRAEARGTNSDAEVGAAAKILCILFDPLKPPKYRQDIVEVRRQFRGIANDQFLQERFRYSLSPIVLTASVMDVFSHAVSALFSVTPEPEASV